MSRTLAPLLLLLGLALAAPALAGPTVLFLGDSLTAGLGVEPEEAYPHLLGEMLVRDGHAGVRVINGGISGSTSASAPARLRWYARVRPEVLFLALGANDGLRGLPIATLRDNLAAMIASAQQKKARVLLVGQRLPPNYGAYAQQFAEVFGEVAKARKAALVDFLLDGIADQPQFFQADHLHPTREAQPRLLDNVWAGLEPLLK